MPEPTAADDITGSTPTGRPPTLRESAALVGSGIWFERRAFEVVGAMVATTSAPPGRAALSAISRHHAWRADQLESVLARTHDLAPDDVVRPAEGFDDAALAALTDPASIDDRLARLATLMATWTDRLRRHRGVLVPVADGPLIRVLDIVIADHERDQAMLTGASAGATAGR